MFTFAAADGTVLYMGRDKHENEDLIKYAWPEDFWFHVDNLSSAHVYVRLAAPAGPDGAATFRAFSLDDIPDAVVRDCAQLVKANSLEGHKKASVVVVYTPASNLRKDGSMAAGQVGFISEKLVRRFVVGERDKETLSRLGKTLVESAPDHAAERARRDAKEAAFKKRGTRERAAAERETVAAFRADKEARSCVCAARRAGKGAGANSPLPPRASPQLRPSLFRRRRGRGGGPRAHGRDCRKGGARRRRRGRGRRKGARRARRRGGLYVSLHN